MNQCDGCVAGIPKDKLGMHVSETGYPVMVCQAYKYQEVKQHIWVNNSPFPTYAHCSECGKVNNPENIGKECRGGISLDDLANLTPDQLQAKIQAIRGDTHEL